MLSEFTGALNELAAAIGYTVIVLSIVYAGVKIGYGLATRNRA